MNAEELLRRYADGERDFRAVNLTRADLHQANLCQTIFIAADLHEANLSGANLGGAKLSEANLNGANLSGANLISCDLSGADRKSVV